MPPTLVSCERMEQGGQEGEQERSAWEGQVTRAAIGAGRATGLHEPGPASPTLPPPRGPHITYESPRGPESSSWGNNRLPLQSALPLKQVLVVLPAALGEL